MEDLKNRLIIAIDGPAASGKSSAGLLLAKRLGVLFFDTGIMYRVITLAAIRKGINIYDEQSIGKLVQTTHIEIRKPTVCDGRINDVLMNGEDVTRFIRDQEINLHVSKISSYKSVRDSLTAQQREIAVRNELVMAGRDIGTVVLPDAAFKFYLDASTRVRANRRYKDAGEIKNSKKIDEIEASIIKRDQIDSSRQIAPLRPAPDAIIINTDEMTLEQVVDEMLEIINGQNNCD